MRRRGLGLGWRLLLFSLLLLALPWLGYRYMTEMKAFLLQGQEEAQRLAAQALATLLHDREDLLGPFDLPPEQRDPRVWLRVHALDGGLQLDGYAEEWRSLFRHRRYFAGHPADPGGAPEAGRFALLLGQYQEYLYGLLQVDDEHIVYRRPGQRRLDDSDQIRLAFTGPGRQIRRYLLLTEGPGNIRAYAVGPDWRYPLEAHPAYDLEGVWRARRGGYTLEFRFPRAWLDRWPQLGLTLVDVDDPQRRHRHVLISTMPGAGLNPLLLPSPGLGRILQGFGRSHTRACVVDRLGQIRASSGVGDGVLCRAAGGALPDLLQQALSGRPRSLQRPVRRADGSDGEMIVTAYPVYRGDLVVGAVVLERDGAGILALQRKALIRTTLETLLVWSLVAVGLLLFGAWLAFRIRRLKREVDGAIDAEGRVLHTRLQSAREARDDLGELSRGISDLLARLQCYTGFLESVPRTLRHEILNPLNTIGMSLQRLEQAGCPERPGELIAPARQAVRQLELIVQGLTEAAHIDAALNDEGAERFDLACLVQEYVANSARLHAKRKFHYQGPESGVMLRGSDLRIAQLLDKILANALDFSPPEKVIEIRLEVAGKEIFLRLRNEGPPLPEQIRQTLFVGMASCRPATDGTPHLGIGLFIARQIAGHHGGTLEVLNRRDPSGVEVILRLPMAT